MNLDPLTAAALMAPGLEAEPSAVVAERVAKARAAATARWAGFGWKVNADVPGPHLRRPPWRLNTNDTSGLRSRLDSGALSARGFDRIIRMAWSISDLDGRDRPDGGDVEEAIQLRTGEGS